MFFLGRIGQQVQFQTNSIHLLHLNLSLNIFTQYWTCKLLYKINYHFKCCELKSYNIYTGKQHRQADVGQCQCAKSALGNVNTVPGKYSYNGNVFTSPQIFGLYSSISKYCILYLFIKNTFHLPKCYDLMTLIYR